jgi:GH15 family glucan-1,4-alpha-glucosidase
MIILANYVIASVKRGDEIENLGHLISAFNKAATFALDHYFRREINLFFSTTSIHESAIERGYSLWVNYAYLRSFHLAEIIHEHIGKTDISKKILEFVPYFESNIHKLLIHNGRYIRRITPEGDYDYKPDITLMSPFYFGFQKLNSVVLRNTIDFMANHLWDPELGMLQRYLPFTEDMHTHIHAGNGPWLQYTAMLARYYYKIGEMKLADKILREIDLYRTREGFIPEHLSTYQRFEEFMRLEWRSGLDFDKEFYREIMVEDLPFDYILEELNNMKRSYDSIIDQQKTSPEGRHIVFAAPLMWSHVEYAKALRAKMKVEANGSPTLLTDGEESLR